MLLVVSLTGKMNISVFPFVPENLVSRDGFGSPAPRQPAHLHTQDEPGVFISDQTRNVLEQKTGSIVKGIK